MGNIQILTAAVISVRLSGGQDFPIKGFRSALHLVCQFFCY